MEGAGTEEAQGEGGVCHGRQDKGFGAKGPMEASWRQVGA